MLGDPYRSSRVDLTLGVSPESVARQDRPESRLDLGDERSRSGYSEVDHEATQPIRGLPLEAGRGQAGAKAR